MWLEVLVGSLGALVVTKFLYQFFYIAHCGSTKRLDGKLVIVTGASAGIGVETALDMARRGARVVMACRNLDKAQKVADRIIRETGNKAVSVKKLDLASLASVRAFANDILSSERELHLLINNAGLVAPSEKTMTEDGLELTMQSNHFGHFLLTNMLGGLLKAGAPSRIVCVSSYGHSWAPKFDADDLSFRYMPYGSMKAYCLSKLCNVLMARELATRLAGTGVTSYSLHPGVVRTEIMFKDIALQPTWKATLVSLLNIISMLFMPVKNPEQGAQTTIYCAVDDAVATHSGLYYSDCKEVPASSAGRNDSYAAKLWTASEASVKLTAKEANI